MNELEFGPILPYIDNENVTDINYNGHNLWIDDLKLGRYLVDDFDNDEFMQQFAYKCANFVNMSFNVTSPLIEAETSSLRISIVHDSIAKSGNSISIRKTPAKLRLTRRTMLEEKYTTLAVLEFLEQCVKKHLNIMVCGLPGVGKTELVKYLSSFIRDNERVITIEDTLELRYHDIHSDKDCVALKINEQFNYVDAIKASLRQRPNWILVSEVRSVEVVYLLESISTGANIISTLHCSHAADIPKRILTMFPQTNHDHSSLMHSIYDSIDIGILITSTFNASGIKRCIQEIVSFNDGEETTIDNIYIKGKGMSELPEYLNDKLEIKKVKRNKND
ncbi:MAG: ATPase, T2SS/T4P/T4SS family [Erysipelotrichaceae bacterium]